MNIPKEQFKQQLKKLLEYMVLRLGLKESPSKVTLKHSKENADKPWSYTGHYNPEDKSICLFISDRHHIDILRTFAHEVIHHWQNENGNLMISGESSTDPKYAQTNPHLRKMEKQAYLLGNIIFRDFEDSERHGEVDSVNENADPKFNNWVNSMVNTVEESLMEMGQTQTDVGEAYDIIKTNFRADSPSNELFQKACREALSSLKKMGRVI